jgi:hypothetical protein
MEEWVQIVIAILGAIGLTGLTIKLVRSKKKNSSGFHQDNSIRQNAFGRNGRNTVNANRTNETNKNDTRQ